MDFLLRILMLVLAIGILRLLIEVVLGGLGGFVLGHLLM
jgi:hypothetical protein